MQNLPKVVIIGAGPSGLTSIRHLKNHAQIFCLEGNRSLGGQWLPIQGNKVDHIENQKNNAYKKYYNSHQSSLYEGLQTNIPHQLMTYKGFSHKKDIYNRESGFLKAEEYLEYLENYSKHFGLHEFMQFNTFVKKVSLVKNLDENCKKQYNITEKTKEKFLVETCQTNDPENQSLFKHFLADHVIVCNGHCIEPSLPEYKNLDTFQGKIIHSHYLLDNSQYEQFSDKVVAIQGVRASGLDILQNLTKILKKPPKKIYVLGGSATKKTTEQLFQSRVYQQELRANLIEVLPGRITSLSENSKTIQITKDISHLQENSENLNTNTNQENYENQKQTQNINKNTNTNQELEVKEIDYIIQCTGYKYSFPFLNKKDNLIFYPQSLQYENQKNDKLFGPLYKRIFAINEPNLMFVGLMERIKSIQITIERGSMIAAMFIKGEIQLPDKNQMLKSWDEDIKHLQKEDPTMTRLFQIRPKFTELDYNQELAELAKKELDYDFEQQTIAIKKIQNAEWSPFDQKLQRQTNFNSLCPKEPSENLF